MFVFLDNLFSFITMYCASLMLLREGYLNNFRFVMMDKNHRNK